MIDVQRLLEILLAGGLVALIGAIAGLLKVRADYVTQLRRLKLEEDQQQTARQKQDTEGQGAIANAAAVLAGAAANTVKMQDAEALELKNEMRALQSEVVALR